MIATRHLDELRGRAAVDRWQSLPRLGTYRARIEDCRLRAGPLVLAAVHSHVGLSVALRSIVAEELLIIAMVTAPHRTAPSTPGGSRDRDSARRVSRGGRAGSRGRFGSRR